MTDPDAPAFAGTNAGLGLTKREYFAAVILSGMSANAIAATQFGHDKQSMSEIWEGYALSAVGQADALIAALNRKAS